MGIENKSVVITVSGKVGAGKTTLAEIISNALSFKGLTHTVIDDGGNYKSKRTNILPANSGFEQRLITIVTKEK